MILHHRHQFRVAEYYRRTEPEQAKDPLARGLVIPIELTFQFWLGGRRLHADAFLDPGADQTMISMRWISEQARAAELTGLIPQSDPRGFLVETVEVTIAEKTLPLGDVDRPVWLGAQRSKRCGRDTRLRRCSYRARFLDPAWPVPCN